MRSAVVPLSLYLMYDWMFFFLPGTALFTPASSGCSQASLACAMRLVLKPMLRRFRSALSVGGGSKTGSGQAGGEADGFSASQFPISESVLLRVMASRAA